MYQLRKFLIFKLIILCFSYIINSAENSSAKVAWNNNNAKSPFRNVNIFNRRRFPVFWRTAYNWEREYNIVESFSFRFFYEGEEVYESSKIGKSTLYNSGCMNSRKIAFILHGWRQSCETDWVQKLIERLTHHRGGCIVCIDYSSIAAESYVRLYRNFRIMSEAITDKILRLLKSSRHIMKGYIFGFSFGGQLATVIGRAVQPFYTFDLIDTCDMAGPGFDLLAGVDHRDSAKHVHCFHSSRDKGTRVYACHQNIRLGNCGYSQPAVFSQPYFSSHGLCVQIYINSFDYPFYAMKSKPRWCISFNPAKNIPSKFTVGYTEMPNGNITGDIFVPTSPNYPYNLSEKEVKALERLRDDENL